MSTAVTALPTSTSLYYKEGSSDKEYHVQIVGSETAGYKVNFQYGRVGNKLTTGTKTNSAVDLSTAQQIYLSLIKEKMSKGYQPKDGGAPAYQDPAEKKKLIGVLPQLLNFIDEEELERYLKDDCCCMQEKKDGVRCMIVKKGKIVTGANRKGEVTSLPSSVENAVRMACGDADATLDGELVGEVFWLFDLLAIGVHAYAEKTYRERLEGIQEWMGDDLRDNGTHSGNLQMVPTAIGKASKKALFNRLKQENAEGVVFKRLDSAYKAGRPASGGNQVKFKFYASASVRVHAVNDKRSVQVEVLEKGDWKFVGNVTIPVNQEIPKAGQIIEVKYLYAFPGGSLFQPTCLGIRTDIDEDACLQSQLKYKQGSVEDEDQAEAS